MLLKPEPLKGLEWMTPLLNNNGTFDNKDLMKNLQQIYTNKLLNNKQPITQASMLMKYFCNNYNSTDLGLQKTSPFKPYQKTDIIDGKLVINYFDEKTPLKLVDNNNNSRLNYSMLNGIQVACFKSGGEKLLCLPQVLNMIKTTDLNEINSAMSSLGIICTECDLDGIELLQNHNILPKEVNACGLISQSNAERLLKYFESELNLDDCKTLNNNSIVSKCTDTNDTFHQIRVTHDCFGQQKGILFPLKYLHPTARCIECLDCGRMFSPKDFVGHTHQDYEERWNETSICHWGFDSSNWRWYLRLSEDFTRTKLEEESLNEYLDEIKKRYCSSLHEMPPKRINSQNPSSAVSQSVTENHFKSLHLSGTVFQHCVSKITSNTLVGRDDKAQLLNALFLLRHEHLQQINNLITERQQLLENLLKKSSNSTKGFDMLENSKISESNQLLINIKSKTSILKRKRKQFSPGSVNIDEDENSPIVNKENSFDNFDKNRSEQIKQIIPKKTLRLDSPLKIECCDSSGENVSLFDSPNTNTNLDGC